jgi:hypothetical protein
MKKITNKTQILKTEIEQDISNLLSKCSIFFNFQFNDKTLMESLNSLNLAYLALNNSNYRKNTAKTLNINLKKGENR